MASNELVERARAAASIALNGDFLRELASSIEALEAERDEAIEGSNQLMAAQNGIVHAVWDLLGGEDQTREGGQNLVTRVKEFVASRQAAEAERDRYKSALFSIAHTFTEDSHGGTKTVPVVDYHAMARSALEKQP